MNAWEIRRETQLGYVVESSVCRVGTGPSRRAFSVDGHINIAAEKERQPKIKHVWIWPGQTVNRGIVGIVQQSVPALPTVKVTEPLAPFVPGWASFTTEIVLCGSRTI